MGPITHSLFSTRFSVIVLLTVLFFIASGFSIYTSSPKHKLPADDFSVHRHFFIIFLQFYAAAVSFGIFLYWLFSLKSGFLFSLPFTSLLIHHGTFSALKEVLGIVGISSILINFILAKSASVTLGILQSDLVNYYSCGLFHVSLFIHFSFTALCLIAIECKAQEVALWTFLTVIIGFIQQFLVFKNISINRPNRERMARKMWKRSTDTSSEELYLTTRRMISFLNDELVRSDQAFLQVLCENIALYLRSLPSITENNIQTIAYLFISIYNTVPDAEKHDNSFYCLMGVLHYLNPYTEDHSFKKYSDKLLYKRYCLTLSLGTVLFLYHISEKEYSFTVSDRHSIVLFQLKQFIQTHTDLLFHCKNPEHKFSIKSDRKLYNQFCDLLERHLYAIRFFAVIEKVDVMPETLKFFPDKCDFRMEQDDLCVLAHSLLHGYRFETDEKSCYNYILNLFYNGIKEKESDVSR